MKNRRQGKEYDMGSIPQLQIQPKPSALFHCHCLIACSNLSIIASFFPTRISAYMLRLISGCYTMIAVVNPDT